MCTRVAPPPYHALLLHKNKNIQQKQNENLINKAVFSFYVNYM